MDILLPTDYYLQFCDGLEVECNDELLMQLQLVDEALGVLVLKGPRPLGATFTQQQLLDIYFNVEDEHATNRNRSRGGRAVALRNAARTCLCLEIVGYLGEGDVDALCATVRATMPFIFSLAVSGCKGLTDESVQQMGSYFFTEASEEEDEDADDVNPSLAHLDLSGCPQLTADTGRFFVGVMSEAILSGAPSAKAKDGVHLLSLKLPRGAMDGVFDALLSCTQQRLQSAPEALVAQLGVLVREVDESLTAKRREVRGRGMDDDSATNNDDDLAEVSFHEMELNESLFQLAKASTSHAAATPARGSNAASSGARPVVRNQQHDEEWYPPPEDGSEDASTPMLPAQTLQTPTRLAAINHRGSNMANRTILGSTAVPSSDLIELFDMIDAYQPKVMDLKTRFMFPGPLSYFPAVHTPDPMLAPGLPGPVYVPRSSEEQGGTAAASNAAASAAQANDGSSSAPIVPRPPSMPPPPNAAASPSEGAAPNNRPSMFTSFFRSAQNSRSNSPRTPRPSPSTPSGLTSALIMPRPPLTARSHPLVQQHQQQALVGSGVLGGVGPTPTPPSAPLGATHSASLFSARPNPRRASFSSAMNVRLSPMPPSEGAAPLGQAGEQPNRPVIPSLPLGRISPSEEAVAPPRKVVDPLLFTLGAVNDALIGSRARLESRHLVLPKVRSTAADSIEEGGLALAMRDPSWNPMVPNRAALIEASLVRHKLNYNVVKKERRKDLPTWMNAREYVAELLIRPTKAETLSSGSMNVEGTLLATTHYDMTCKLWRAESGELVHNLVGHTNHLSDCAWNAPMCDRLITSSFDKTLKVWDVATGREVFTLTGHELEVVCVAVSPSGKLCASGGMDDLAIIWDLEQGVERFNLLGHEGEVIALDFSPCGERLVTGSMDETVRIWNVLDGTQIRKLEGHTAEVNQVKFNCFGNMIISGSIDTTCRLWDVETGQSKALRGHTHEVVDCDFSPDGWTCASASDDTTIRIWDVLTGGCTMLLVGHSQGVCRLLYTPDGASIVTGSLDSTAKVWNVSTGACKQTLGGHKGLVIASYNGATDRIITMSRDNTCRLWRLEAPQNSLTGMAALAISRSADTCKAITEHKVVPPTLVKLLEGFFKKVNQEERDKLTAIANGGGNRPCDSVPQIPSAEAESRLGGRGTADNDLLSDTPEGGGEDVTRVVNLRSRSRQFNIPSFDEIRVE